MEALFWICFVLGILYAVVSIIFGDVLGDALESLSVEGLGWLSPMSFVGGLTVFGGTGILLVRYSAFGIPSILALSLLAAVVIGAGLYWLYIRPMQNSENSTAYSVQGMIGQIAEVSVPIPPTGYGEVLVRVGGAGVTNQIAASHDGEALVTGARVVIVEVKDHTLFVSKLEL